MAGGNAICRIKRHPRASAVAVNNIRRPLILCAISASTHNDVCKPIAVEVACARSAVAQTRSTARSNLESLISSQRAKSQIPTSTCRRAIQNIRSAIACVVRSSRRILSHHHIGYAIAIDVTGTRYSVISTRDSRSLVVTRGIGHRRSTIHDIGSRPDAASQIIARSQHQVRVTITIDVAHTRNSPTQPVHLTTHQLEALTISNSAIDYRHCASGIAVHYINNTFLSVRTAIQTLFVGTNDHIVVTVAIEVTNACHIIT